MVDLRSKHRAVARVVRPSLRFAALATAALALAGCGGGSFGGAQSSGGDPSLTDRFYQLFGSNSQAATTTVTAPTPSSDASLPVCPAVSIRPGASTFAVGVPGREATGNDLRYQATIVRTARDCSLNDGMVTARIGIQGRVIVGPAGAPATVEVPIRIAVVQGGVSEKTIFTRAYRTTVTMQGDNTVPFSLVAEDVVYPAPTAAVGDSYIFYIGFDPQALRPEPRGRNQRRR
ncbi:MAG: hypothetical protein M9932_14660 [Xanthobacteraceae bacterium]|nr:hypothetical protein [Xanthobacteraceae bacterium]